MAYLVLQEGNNGASAYSLSLLAGCAGYGTEEEFIAACEQNSALMLDTVRQATPFIHEEGSGKEAAYQAVKSRLASLRLEIAVDLPAIEAARAKESSQEFEALLRVGQGAVLVQTSRIRSFRKSMTTAAIALATAAALSLSMIPRDANAFDFKQILSDTLGGTIGGAIGSKIGGGNGRVLATAVGAAVGVQVAEQIRKPQSQPPQQSPQPSREEGAQAARPVANQDQYGMVSGGTTVMSPDKRDKMVYLERNLLSTRDAFAKSLSEAQQAEDNRMLSPHDRDAYERAVAANTATQSYGQRYNQARSDFDNAYEYLARRGYDVHEYAYTYMLTQKQVTAQDVNYRDMARPEQQQQRAARPQMAVLNEDGPSF